VKKTARERLGFCLLAAFLMGAAEGRGELAVSHLLGEARALKILQTQGGAILFTAEARIGKAGDWAVGMRRLPSDPPTATGRFDGWPNGSPVPFTLRYDGRRTLSLTLGAGSPPSTATLESDKLAGLDELFVSALAADPGTSVILAGLKLNGLEVGSAPAAADAGVKGQDVLRIQGGRFVHGFTLTGTMTLSWQSARPEGSALRALFWGAKGRGKKAVDEEAGVRITAPGAESILPNGTPAITATFPAAIDPASAVLLLDGTDRTGQATVSASGLTFTPATRLPEGKHTAQVTVRGRAGAGRQAAVSFTTDTVPPAIAFSSPPELVTDTPAPVIRLTYSDSTSGIEPGTLKVTLDGKSIDSICVANLASGSCLTESVAEGPHTLTATVRDRAGNAGTASFGFTLTLNGENP
jgi:hypothetical protein